MATNDSELIERTPVRSNKASITDADPDRQANLGHFVRAGSEYEFVVKSLPEGLSYPKPEGSCAILFTDSLDEVSLRVHIRWIDSKSVRIISFAE
jgi:hypothetical protein